MSTLTLKSGYTILETLTDVPDTDNIPAVEKIESAWYMYQDNPTSANYIAMFEGMKVVLYSSFGSVNTLLESQATNTNITQSGWDYLTTLVQYLALKANDDTSASKGSRLNTLALRLGSFNHIPTVNAGGEVEGANTQLRHDTLGSIFEEMDCLSSVIPLSTSFLAPMWSDPELTSNFVRLFFIGQPQQ